MRFLLRHWILMKSLENKNKTLIAPHTVLETPHYSTDKTDDALVWFCVNVFKPVAEAESVCWTSGNRLWVGEDNHQHKEHWRLAYRQHFC